MRLLIITQYFLPEPVPKVELLARSLVERGHQVTVLTGMPCYPEGRIYPVYRGKHFLTENMRGIEVIRVPQIPDHSANVIWRVMYYLSFPLFAALRLLTLGGREFDVAYFYGSAVPVLALAPLTRRIFGVRCLFDVADLWPESVESSGMLRSRWATQVLSRICGFLYRRADHLGAVTKGYKLSLVNHGIPPENISVIYYCVADSPSPPTEIESTTGQFIVAFTGMIGRPQNLGVLLDCAKLLLDTAKPVRFLVAGSGVEYHDLVQRRDSEGLHNVEFLGRLPSESMPGIYGKAHALLVHLKPDSLSLVSIPSKTYSYLASGRPIIMAVDGEAGKFVEENGCGVRVKAGDPVALADAIIRLSQMPKSELLALGRAARKTFEAKHSASVHVDRWEQLLQRFARAPAGFAPANLEPAGN